MVQLSNPKHPDGLYVRVWSAVKPGSLTSDSFVLLDGTDESGVRVITSGLPGVNDGERVIYRR